jgi:hypothetical protein
MHKKRENQESNASLIHGVKLTPLYLFFNHAQITAVRPMGVCLMQVVRFLLWSPYNWFLEITHDFLLVKN